MINMISDSKKKFIGGIHQFVWRIKMSYKDHKIEPDMQDWSDSKYLILVKSHNYSIDQIEEINKHFAEMTVKYNNLKADFEKYKHVMRNRVQ